MKRDINLVPLSREHHFGLLFCWKIKMGLSKKVAPDLLRSYALYFWQEYLSEHFDKEEESLLPLLPVEDPLRQQMLEEHGAIRQTVAELEQGSTITALASLQHLVNKHIRFEERELFPYLESKASDEQLVKVSEILEEHGAVAEDNFEPQFWAR